MSNNKKLVILVVASLFTISGSLQASCGKFCDTWVKVRDTITSPFREPIRSSGQELGKGMRKEFEAAMQVLFDQKLGPLIADINTKVKDLIVQSGQEVNRVIDHGSDKFKEVENQLKGHVDEVINSVDVKYRGAMHDTFDELNKARTEAIVGIRAVVGDTNSMLEKRINQVTLVTMQALTKVEAIVNNFTPGKFRTDLVDPLMNQLTGLEKDIFSQLDRLVEKVACTAIGSVDLVTKMLNDTLDRVPLIKQNQCASCGGIFGIFQAKCPVCCNRVNMAIKGSPTIFEKYRLGQCYTLTKLENMPTTEPVRNIKDAYGDLHVLARLFYCSGMAIQSEPMMEEALTDAVQYHELWKLWK